MFEFEGSAIEKFYNGVKLYPIGQLLTFAQLADVGFNVKADRSLIYNANKYLLKNDRKMLINERGVGYKMAEAKEQMAHAWNRKACARRQVTKAVLESVHLDTSKLTADERKLATDREIYLKQQLRGLRKIKKINIAAQRETKATEKMATKLASKAAKSTELQQESLNRINDLLASAESLRRQIEGK